MSRSRQHRAWELITASALLFTLLLVLLPHAHHLTVAAACPVLAVMFLFGAVCVAYSLLLLSQASDEHLPQSPSSPHSIPAPPSRQPLIGQLCACLLHACKGRHAPTFLC